ncbi:hypothetical protein GCM10027160_23410 [Streptomyces calidiresistens]|uniref:Uncharacterized protein n=1 Tax=Streptomyces calidiresistens TaxID=1485586 RepID=A0A7W3T8K0_9ACTN|nr:hypothetical protein [Streptomyces calidiresistens]MBB0232894.1 hypothetical protein [Streptomyces calidiresistens]
MPITYRLHRGGRPTDRVVSVTAPHELEGGDEKTTKKLQAKQARIVGSLDRSAKWQRTDGLVPAAGGHHGPDLDALVEARVQAELARRAGEDKTTEGGTAGEKDEQAKPPAPRTPRQSTRRTKPDESKG